jgi:biotin carboxyl carrier protein
MAEVHGVLHSLSIGDQHVELLAASEGDRVRLALGGREYLAEVLDEARARLASLTAARGAGRMRHELRAPMPGLLVRVLCQVGDQAEPGKPLAVLQAMKMENELSLAYGGTVKEVNAEAGQTVEQGQVLVVIE